MSLPGLSIKRPIFVTCVFLLVMILGYLSLKKMPVDLFPDIAFPIVTVNTIYPGASPREIETLISKPLEDEISTIAGIKKLSSVNKEGVSVIIAEFTLKTDIRDAEQQIRNHLSVVRNKLPDDIKEPIVARIDPASLPILQVTLSAPLPEGALYDLADEVIRPQLQQVPQVGLVEILGGRKREIHVKLDLDKLRTYEISASQISRQLSLSGKNIPIGKIDLTHQEKVFRLIGEYPSIKEIENTLIRFTGNENPIKISDLGSVEDTLEDEKARTFVNGEKALILNVFKQSKTNTVAVATDVQKKVENIQKELEQKHPGLKLSIMQDTSIPIRDNVDDVKESIFLGIALTVVVVFFFLGNFRSTIITGLALPNSLLGAFILMSVAGFSINMMSLLSLSLAVGLLIDDAIVVRENIFRHIELGAPPARAALEGTQEVLLAVVATSFTILAVFGPIAFLQGMVGQFFKEFGLTICFAMVISLLDAITMAPMLSAYFAGKAHEAGIKKHFLLFRPFYFLVDLFNRFQNGLEWMYENLLKKVTRHPLLSLFLSTLIFASSLFITRWIPKTFLPPQDFGEFMIYLEDLPGTSLDRMDEKAQEIYALLLKNPEVEKTILTIGDKDGQSNLASIYVHLVPRAQRTDNTSEFKEKVRTQLASYTALNPRVTDVDMLGIGARPFNLMLIGEDLEILENYTQQVFERLKNHPVLQDPEISHKPGKPEVQVAIHKKSAEDFGLTSDMVGLEIRTLVEGTTPAVYRENGLEYDIRVRAKENQRNLEESFSKILVPNTNFTQVPLSKLATLEPKQSPVTINRQNRGRYIQISGDIRPDSAGMGGLITDIRQLLDKDLPLPPGVTYTFVGQAENFEELLESMVIAIGLGIIFIYFVLASLYESFITPFTIMLVLPLAACGAFFALLVTRQSLDIYSMIGCVMLMGVATKNSILLVDYTHRLMEEGMERTQAIITAGKTRLRPILMTSVALIAGMIPVAIGLNEAAKQRVSMGISVIGGVISSTLLTLIVIPAAFSYIDRFNRWIIGFFRRKTGV